MTAVLFVCIEGAHTSVSLVDLIILAVQQGSLLLAHAWH